MRPPVPRRQRPSRRPATGAAWATWIGSASPRAGRLSRRVGAGDRRQRVQRECEIAGGLESRRRVLLETPQHQPLQRRCRRRVRRGEVERVFRKNGVERLDARRLRERFAPGEHLVEDAPKEKISARWSTFCPRTCSGDMYPTVPSTTPGLRCRRPASPGRERSRRRRAGELRQAEVDNLGAFIGRDETFSGLRSRCTMPRSCAAARPRAICAA